MLESTYNPAIAAAGLMLNPRVYIEPGGSNVVKVPSGARTKPCDTLLASKYCPVIAPAGLMA